MGWELGLLKRRELSGVEEIWVTLPPLSQLYGVCMCVEEFCVCNVCIQRIVGPSVKEVVCAGVGWGSWGESHM